MADPRCFGMAKNAMYTSLMNRNKSNENSHSFGKIWYSGSYRSVLILMPYLAEAQYFVVGQDPSSIKWRQIQTDNFQIIYPSDYEIQAQRVAHIFEKVYNYSGITLKHQAQKNFSCTSYQNN